MNTTASRTRRSIRAAARVISLKHCGCVVAHSKPCMGCEDLAEAVLAAANQVDQDPEGDAADARCGASHKTYLYGRLWCVRVDGCGDGHRDLYDGTWTD